MVATITSQHGIERVQSNCSLSPLQYLADDKTSVQVSLAEGHKFDRDVELLIYYNEVHSPSVAVEMGMQDMKPDSLMGAPSAMVSFYPDVPEVEATKACGEFVFLMDRSGSMESPMNNQIDSQLRIEAAKETLLLLLKSLPMGCYFNIYGFGSSFEKIFPESVKYTQETMEEAVERVKDLEADLGGTEILKPLRKIYKAPSIPGHPLQLFVFTDGEVSDTFTVINEVLFNSKKHRCFSFGIGEGASTSLIKGIARVTGGTAEFIIGKDRMQTKALGSLKLALNSSVDDISLSWDLPPCLSACILSPKQTAICRGQRLIIYAQLTGTMPQEESSGEVCFKYTFKGRSLENRVTFSLQPKTNASFTIHRLAAKSLIQTKDLGFHETSERAKKDVASISIQSGVLSSFTAFLAINKELSQPVRGPVTQREIPRPVMSTSHRSYKVKLCFRENLLMQLISRQKGNGSWELDEDLAKILRTNLEDIMTANPVKDGDPSTWATVLAVLWLHANSEDLKCEWELLERKAVAWLHDHAGSSIPMLLHAGSNLLKLPVTPAIFGF
ncbi:von Willebrand factor A domain-containing protein 5A [Microtus ochrogaster]|uniref:von Willebrand factor A domain-containing protein 5A n=1 Tax=Microtus ochrogaster TaxID=79684 RepID=A0A8J6GRG4_MICOH|nr:von Willebrand factor A domain-containing protein 5A [Microtus ochrogaster]